MRDAIRLSGGGAMRVLSMIVLMTLSGASAVLPGQVQQENWSRCKSDDPDRKIGGCSAWPGDGCQPGEPIPRPGLSVCVQGRLRSRLSGLRSSTHVVSTRCQRV